VEWVAFTSASQATSGARMRAAPTGKRKGRPASLRVDRRETRSYIGNIIVFSNGSYIKISEAKSAKWLVLE